MSFPVGGFLAMDQVLRSGREHYGEHVQRMDDDRRRRMQQEDDDRRKRYVPTPAVYTITFTVTDPEGNDGEFNPTAMAEDMRRHVYGVMGEHSRYTIEYTYDRIG